MSPFSQNSEYQIRLILGDQDNLGALPRGSRNPSGPPQIYNFRNQPVDWHLTVREVTIESPLKEYDTIHSALTPQFWKEWNDLMVILAQCSKLTEVELKNLPLTEIPTNFQIITQIAKLTIKRQIFHGWPSGLEKMTHLQELTFDESTLLEIPPDIGLLKNLTTLNIQYNRFLTKIAPEIGQLSKLEKLVIVTSVPLPPTIEHLSSLRSLYVRSPDPILFPFNFGTLSDLEVLSLIHSCPAEFPAGICDLKALRNLRIDHSPLLTLPETFGNLQALRKLHIEHSPLTALPEAFGNLQALENLTLIDNDLVALPETLCSLLHLKRLKLENNRLETLPDSIGKLHLDYLSIHDNRITMFPSSFGDLLHPQIMRYGISIDEEYVRSLHGLPPALVKHFFDPDRTYHSHLFDFNTTHLSRDFLVTVHIPFQSAYRNVRDELVTHTVAYYAKSAVELANQAVHDHESLTNSEWDRLAHEGTYRERQILETVFPLDHPVLTAISARIYMEPFHFNYKCYKKREGKINENEIIHYHDTHLIRQDAETLFAIESLVSQPIPVVSEVNRESFGFVFQEYRVVQLGLYKRDLAYLPANIGNLTSLTYLDLSNNELTTLPDSFGDLISLKTLELNNNILYTLPTSFKNLTLLKELNLEKNKLSPLPDWIGNLTSLTFLNLSINELTILPDSIGNLTSLTLLSSRCSSLATLPANLGNLTSLTYLDLGNNDLTTLPDWIGNLTSLEYLFFSLNKLTTFPASIGNLKSLIELKIDMNKLTYLPESIKNLPLLMRLDISFNQFTSLPDNVEKALKILEDHGCNIIR